MKFLALILCFYISALVLMPCHDQAHGCAVSYTELSAPDAHAGCNADQCSPFCTCSCCSVSVVSSTTGFDLPAVTLPVKTLLTFYKEYLPVSYISIWQPPKV